MAKTNPFDFVDSVSSSKEDIMDRENERDYSPYLTNRALSYHADSVLYAAEMNLWRDLENRLQYDYLRHSLRRRGRRSKWHKPEDTEAIDLLCWRYNISRDKARAALAILTPDHVQDIKRQREAT